MSSETVDIQDFLRHPISLNELKRQTGTQFYRLVEQLYDGWRTQKIFVTRIRLGFVEQPTQVAYSSHAFLLLDDQFQLRSTEGYASIKVATWNVNSIRVRLSLLLSWLQTEQPDVVCLQETKTEDNHFPEWELKLVGYHSVYAGQKSYNGVAILSKLPIDEVKYGFSSQYDSSEKRFISASIAGIQIMNAYVPQGQTTDSPKFAYKQEFLENLLTELQQNYSSNSPLLLAGDFNIAPDVRDVVSADTMKNQVSFHPIEHEYLAQFQKWGLTDLYRKWHKEAGQYTWWDFRTRGFKHNEGMRIDHLWGTLPLAEICASVEIDFNNRSQPKPSDHAPVLCVLKPKHKLQDL
ncbi:exodeoxyribonuclease III [Deltaproteobacteria bacterium TL4]